MNYDPIETCHKWVSKDLGIIASAARCLLPMNQISPDSKVWQMEPGEKAGMNLSV
jgi:hypothetical protein